MFYYLETYCKMIGNSTFSAACIHLTSLQNTGLNQAFAAPVIYSASFAAKYNFFRTLNELPLSLF